MMTLRFFLLVVLAFLGFPLHGKETYTPGETLNLRFDGFPLDYLETYCLDCHDNSTKKGGLSLEDLGPVDESNAGQWKAIWAQVSLREMPPKDKFQPLVVERLRFADWVVEELQETLKNKGGFTAHLDPKKGNFLDHDLLFGPLPEEVRLVPPSSPARLWRITPQEHLTRLNELINTEPAYRPDRSGLRTRGDVVPTNHGGELKLYFGTDRILKWQGGTVAYATSVKSVPAVLSSSRKHGFENYAHFHTVNSAEATQILGMAGDLLRYMACGPLSIANPEQITDDPSTYKMEGDIRGLPTAIVYSTKVVRPLTPVYDLLKDERAPDGKIKAAVDHLFEALTFRPPTGEESAAYVNIVRNSIDKVGREDGIFLGLSALFLHRDALFRPELVESGTPDAHGRILMQDWELGRAVNHALRYLKPDEALRQAILEGRMRTREDVKREITRLLDDPTIRKPRILRFFRDFFDHDLAGYICKDSQALSRTGVRGGNGHYRAMFDATASTDRLIELILEEDRDVLKQLLTTQKVVATRNDEVYFGRKRSPEEIAAIRREKAREAAEAKREEAAAVKKLEGEIAAIRQDLKKSPDDRKLQKSLVAVEKKLTALQGSQKQNRRQRGRENPAVAGASLKGERVFARVSRRSFGNGSMKPERTLATAPEGERLGLLTHPSWLVSHSDAMGNHAIHRGIWIRERLLGGGIPDVPITVDAMLPDEPETTLRERMRVTREDYCWTCHQKMDPLGLPFEQYNQAGLYRTTELGRPVDTSGEIIDSGDPALDGPVEGPLEMIRRLAESERVEQVFVRHAFRYWMGRNETLNDAPVLQEAHGAYRDSKGSMKALITSLVTSDAFLYRKRESDPNSQKGGVSPPLK